MNITILCPKSEFTPDQVRQLNCLGQVRFTPNRQALSRHGLTNLVRYADILGIDPDNLGGFEVAPQVLKEVLPKATRLKGIALDTTSYGYLNLDYCKKRQLSLTYVPGYSTEAVAEQALAFMLLASKRIVESDRLTQQGKYTLLLGRNLHGKILGIIGLGQIGLRVAQLGQALGMQVLAWNRTPRSYPGIAFLSLKSVLKEADFLSLNLADSLQTKGFLNRGLIKLLKPGVIIINVSDRHLVDEEAIAAALQSGQVSHYVLEAGDLLSPPLSRLPNALLFKGFGWYTRESLAANKQIWVDNIIGLASGHPQNPIPSI
ncbi:MAG: hypothetical protein UV66_C0007G0008 [Candidatus Woesebacteria bacterium GW2011_GWA1_43_12]|uniref:Glycerate dehydrogenase n=1 Tax=Candidatus Woesebacteria bacterium GW2011_GWA1_43_12 TaxID=1618557 RepID=A0A0G1F4V5_9BACT|nr:MAG: hypothetical protein UV66_C0007G0008 [Candidatus Woesebacteria bacterium GW2011_GWA1_43_12]